ncbi:MAG: hypothetical protein ABI882_10935, partial [Acidobacteriota bacterium]
MSNRLGRFARKLGALTLAGVCAAPAIAQTPVPGQDATQAQKPPISRPVPERTVGLEPGKILRWTLRDAVIAALEKNVDIEIERKNVRLAQFDIDGARGVYDHITS